MTIIRRWTFYKNLIGAYKTKVIDKMGVTWTFPNRWSINEFNPCSQWAYPLVGRGIIKALPTVFHASPTLAASASFLCLLWFNPWTVHVNLLTLPEELLIKKASPVPVVGVNEERAKAVMGWWSSRTRAWRQIKFTEICNGMHELHMCWQQRRPEAPLHICWHAVHHV